ncbi:MAG: glycosyltransferase [Clostridiales bacterium]|nr:glycosyltransferase [Clostridiales bacterium]
MISIIIPIYKVEKYLKKCVDSVLSQIYKDLEIILVDDGSPDNCPQICDEYAKSYSRVKVVHKKNGGLMSARQAGSRVAKGEYVTFVDGDDWIDPDMYENFVKVIERYNPDIALCEFYFSYPNEEKKSTQNLSKPYFNKVEAGKEIYPTMLFKDKFYSFGINPCCWSKIVKREILEKIFILSHQK